MMLGGMIVFTSIYLTENGPAEEMRRTLGERLFQFKPWRPFKLTKTIIPQIPSNTIYKVNGKDGLYAAVGVPLSDNWFLVMHPEMAKKVSIEMAAHYNDRFKDQIMGNFIN